MYSYPNLIPLPEATRRPHRRRRSSPTTFEVIYGAWWDRLVRRDAKAIVRRSARALRARAAGRVGALAVEQASSSAVRGMTAQSTLREEIAHVQAGARPGRQFAGLSTIFAALPLVTLFVLLGGLKLKAHVAALWSLLVAILVAIIVYSMPRRPDARRRRSRARPSASSRSCGSSSTRSGSTTMLERSGYFAVIKRSFGRLSEDQRVQAVLIAFCFGALLEALAGFGTPVAICSVMLIGLGFKPAKAAAVASWPTPRRWPSAPSRCRSRRWRRWPTSPRTTSAPWSAARRPSWPSSSRSSSSAWSTGAAASRPPGPPRWWAASPSPSASSRARTTSRSSWPTSSPRWLGAGAIIALLQVWQPGDVAAGGRRCRRAPGDGRRRERGRPAALREGGAPARRRRTPTATVKRDTPGRDASPPSRPT